MLKAWLFLLFISVLATPSRSQANLPQSINIVSGVPLTLPESALESMGIKPQENTGGWGDVMSNVAMALELKKQFPEINIRLIVTLNDTDSRPYVNKVRNFIPNILRDGNDQTYLNPDQKEVQYYKGVEIYFASVSESLGLADPSALSAEQKSKLNASVAHIPHADMGLQYSANNSSFNQLVVKEQKLHIYFEEYSQNSGSHAYTFLRDGRRQIKLNAGPLGFGVYGFGSSDDSHGSKQNRKYIANWLKHLSTTHPSLAKFDLSWGSFDIAFAYAGDNEMVEDYVKAVSQLAKKNKHQPIVIAYKGSGEIKIVGQQIFIPLGAHPKELAHALISESSYSPLVTGDGSLSSALETTTEKKSFIYENVAWKSDAMNALFSHVFADSKTLEPALLALVPQSKDLAKLKLSRSKRVKQIQSALKNSEVHAQWHSYFAKRKTSLNLADNTVNIFQFISIYTSLEKSFSKGLYFSDFYVSWLVELAKTFSARNGLPYERLRNELNDGVYGKSKNLVEKWFALFTLWETSHLVNEKEIARVLHETADFLEQRKTEVNYSTEEIIFSIFEQINGSEKSKYALYLSIKNDLHAYESFTKLRRKYNSRSSKPLKLSRSNSCLGFYSN